LIAFETALETGAPMIELDVTFSSDRKVVVIHDATLERTTNGHGPVSDYSLAELKQLDAGSWFDAQFFENPGCLPAFCIIIKFGHRDRKPELFNIHQTRPAQIQRIEDIGDTNIVRAWPETRACQASELI